jgi:RHS repeat-associated protein
LWEHIYLGDLPVAVIGSAGGVFPVLSDHLGTPRQVINASKQLRWKWDNTEPFGANAANQNPANLGVFAYNLRFPGQYFDAETGLHYNYFRDYNPQTGRYIESDPIGLSGGLNTYTYVGGNPVRFVDPTGEDAVAGAIGGRIGSWGGGIIGEIIDPAGGGIPGSAIGGALGSAIGSAVGDAMASKSDSVHPEEQELLDATCDDVSWAIPELEALIASLKARYKAHGGGNIQVNPRGPGHPERIKILEKKLKWLYECPKASCSSKVGL